MNPLEIIKSGTDTIIGLEELQKRLQEGRSLKIKLGVDPTRPDLTFGHMVVFNKLRQFQDLGHEAILLIGDYTATIGDPSGRSALRPVLTEDEVKQNTTTYLEQAFKVLDKDKTTVRYNSEWLKPLSFSDALNLSRKMTVARMLERDDFSKRYASNTPISIVEFLYPLVQGYDSVVLKADVELGGTDQLFNMLVGRALQKDDNQPEQAVICMPLLVGLDGVKKMSKSADNYISFNDSPKDMFGKIMSVSDDNMWDYYRLLLGKSESQIEALKADHPMKVKKELALTLVSQLYSKDEAQHELEQFDQVFSKNELPDDMPVFAWNQLSESPEASLIELLAKSNLFPSKKEARRLVEQGAVKVSGEKQNNPQATINTPSQEESIVIQAGKRCFFKVSA